MNTTLKLSEKVWQNPLYFVAFGFGSGLMPFAPGTWGTLAAVPVYLLLVPMGWPIYMTVTLLAFIGYTWLADVISKETNTHDYPGLVCDEVVGYLLTMFMVPVSLTWMITGFVLFRLFDIWKPQPIRMMDEKIPGGFGIMIDDVAAALCAWIILQVLVRVFA